MATGNPPAANMATSTATAPWRLAPERPKHFQARELGFEKASHRDLGGLSRSCRAPFAAR